MEHSTSSSSNLLHVRHPHSQQVSKSLLSMLVKLWINYRMDRDPTSSCLPHYWPRPEQAFLLKGLCSVMKWSTRHSTSESLFSEGSTASTVPYTVQTVTKASFTWAITSWLCCFQRKKRKINKTKQQNLIKSNQNKFSDDETFARHFLSFLQYTSRKL